MQKTEEFFQNALHWVGTPFAHRQAKRAKGADCLGLIMGALKETDGRLDFSFPRYASPDDKQAHKGLSPKILEPIFSRKREPELSNGDVLVFELRPQVYWHLGIYTGENTFLSAWRREGVSLRALDEYWRARLQDVYELKEKTWQH